MNFQMRWKKIRIFAVPLLGMLLALVISGSPLASFMGRAVYDHLLGLTKPPQVESQVAVIAVDNASLERFPEPIALWHAHWADVLDGVSRVGVRGIAMDMVFAVSLESIAPELDRRLMQSLKTSKTRGVPIYLGIAAGPYAQMPQPKFAVFSSGLGFLNLTADSDKVVRRQILIQTNPAGKRLLSLPRLLTAPALSPKTSDQTEAYIDYRYPPPPEYSFSEVHQWSVDGNTDRLSDAFGGKFVLLGFQAPILQDLHAAPRPALPDKGHLIPGLMIHAQIAQTLLAANLLRDAPFGLTLILCFFLWLSSSWIFYKWTPSQALAIMGGIILAGGIGLFQAFRFNLVLPAGPLICFAVFPGLVAGLYQFASESRQRRVLQNYFGRYVHPKVVEDILKDPRQIAFGGKAVVVTVMFTDIRNFTTLSERREPGEVLRGLNRYFESMNGAIDVAGGYLNRTLGDGILALFGAPFPLPDDGARAAIQCGLDMLRRLEKLNRENIFPGAGPIQIGIGIHTGRAIVGNVGSHRKLEYTIVGDTANLAARIEGLTKTYNVPLLASEETLSKIKHLVDCRFVDTTAVKGRDQKVSVYAVEAIRENGKEKK